MAAKSPKTPLLQRKLDAETRASQWLADGNEAREGGKLERAEHCYGKAQFWLDRANLLSNRGATAAPIT
jgi:hypothetical protein